MQKSQPETQTKKEATQHHCLPSLMGDGVKVIEIVYGDEKNIFTAPNRTAKTEQRTNEPAKEGPLTFVLFAPVSTATPL
jgi:hypothetical protein